MKIRKGFVSNSSSSSFVVFFPREPKSVDDVKIMLFGDETRYSSYYSENYDTNTVAKTVWGDICDQEKNDLNRAIEIISSGSIDDPNAPNYDYFSSNKDWRLSWELYDQARKKFAQKKMNELFNIRKLKLKTINGEPIDHVLFYCFKYGDNDGDYFSALEHGDLFRKLKHIRVSNH